MITSIPANYRQLKSDEVIRKGDLYIDVYNNNKVKPVVNSVGLKPSAYAWSAYTWHRRRHTKMNKGVPATKSRRVVPPSPATEPVKKPNVTIVSFSYKGNSRLVQLISLDTKYLTGLEITRRDRRNKYQFKRFLISRMESDATLYHYGPALTN